MYSHNLSSDQFHSCRSSNFTRRRANGSEIAEDEATARLRFVCVLFRSTRVPKLLHKTTPHTHFTICNAFDEVESKKDLQRF